MTDYAEFVEGVYLVERDNSLHRIHRYMGGDYGLEDVVETLRLGQLEAPGAGQTAAICLSSSELTQLKVLADYFSFDFEAGFVEMCQEMTREVATKNSQTFHFVANF